MVKETIVVRDDVQSVALETGDMLIIRGRRFTGVLDLHYDRPVMVYEHAADPRHAPSEELKAIQDSRKILFAFPAG